MIDELTDIETLKDAIIALTEGASDEKRMAIYSLERMLDHKIQVVEEFEAQGEAA